eukprot:RCo048411
MVKKSKKSAEPPTTSPDSGAEKVGQKRARVEAAACVEDSCTKHVQQHEKTLLRVELSPKAKGEILSKVLKQALPGLKHVAYSEPWNARGLFGSAQEAKAAISKGSVQALGEAIPIASGGYPEEVRFQCRSWLEKQLVKASGISGAGVQTGDHGSMTLSARQAVDEGKVLTVAGVNVPLLSPTVPLVHLNIDLMKFQTDVVKGFFPKAVQVAPAGHVDVKVTFPSEDDARAVFSVEPPVLSPRLGGSPKEVRLLCADYLREKILAELAPQGAVAVVFYRFNTSGNIAVLMSTRQAAEKLKAAGKVTILRHSFRVRLEKPMKLADV